jgi:hypothetical protein
MKLVKVQIKNFRSIEDTEVFNVGDLTCLVGKNEAGKTAILKALEAQFPVSKPLAAYDLTRDYPRRFYADAIRDGEETEIEVCTTWWELDTKSKDLLVAEFGEDSVKHGLVTVKSGYNFGTTHWTVPINESKAINNLIANVKMNAAEKSSLGSPVTATELQKALDAIAEPTEKHKALSTKLKTYRKGSITLKAIDIISLRVPKFFYASHYDRMSGQISVETQAQLHSNSSVIPKGDEIFESFLSLAGTSLDELKDSRKLEDLKAKCEAASNNITEQIFKYWSQNDALDVQIDISPGKPDDPAPFNTGTVVSARVYNGYHKASVPFSERSAGFVWFFSFLVQFATIKEGLGNIIVLLDEPGLTLHGKAQADLLRYIEEELLPKHQVIFSTHSPFLVPSDRLNDVRIVEDQLIYKEGARRPEVKGTKVSEEVLSKDRDTLFPLQGAMGYDICQSLFVGKHTLLVEGPSDILYLQTLSNVLRKIGKTGLDYRWTLCPSGGIDKVQPFISLFGGRAGKIDIAVLTDQGKGDKSKVEKLKQSQLLHAGRAYSIGDFTGSDEADIEDLFAPEIYVSILNSCYRLNGENVITVEKLINADTSTTRLVKKAEALFRMMPTDVEDFDHYAPSMWLLQNPQILESESAEIHSTLERAEKVFETYNKMLVP